MIESVHMPKISLLVPTRGRPFLLKRLLDSLSDTVSEPKNIEVVLYMDSDDYETHSIEHTSIPLVKLIRHSGSSMGNIFRECYRSSRGRYQMLMNDDVVFRTNDWDLAVIRAFERFNDDIAFVYGNDLDQGKSVPTFPILSKKVCELMGSIVPAGYLNLHIESHLIDIFNQLKARGHDRIVYLDDVIFEHMHYSVGKSQKDAVSVKKNPLRDQQLFIELDDERSYMAARLANFIEHGGIAVSPPDDSGRSPLVSIVTHYSDDNAGRFKACFDAIKNGSGEASFEVIAAVSDSSTPVLSNQLARFINNKGGQSVPGALNTGAKEARGEYIVFLDLNCTPGRDWLTSLLKAAKEEVNFGAIGCKHLNKLNGRICHAGISAYRDNGRLKLTCIYRGFKPDKKEVNVKREFQMVSGAAVLINKKLFFEAGGLDEESESYWDLDLCLKLKSLEKKVIYIPEATIICNSDVGRDPKDFFRFESKWGSLIEIDLSRFLAEDGYTLSRSGKFYILSAASIQ